MNLNQYIKILQDFVKDYGDLEVTMTESGYYSNGEECLYDYPEVKGDTIVLGHSHQSY